MPNQAREPSRTRHARWIPVWAFYPIAAGLAGSESFLAQVVPGPVEVKTMKTATSAGCRIAALVLSTLAVCAAPPVIQYQPAPQRVILYQTAALGVIAGGTPPLSYEWFKNGVSLPGATNDQIVFAHAQFADQAVYSVIVSNAEGTATSSNAALAIKLPQAGGLDGSFVHPSGMGQVFSTLVQSDGRILIGGAFSPNTSDLVHGGVTRLKTDGTVDHTFLNGYCGANGTVHAVAIQADGKILIGGGFTLVNGSAHTNLARLNRDGSLDDSFGPSFDGPRPAVYSVVVQDDGKILVGGAFQIINGLGRTNLARLNPDGSLDDGFQDPGIGPSPGSEVRAVCVGASSKWWVALPARTGRN